MPLFRANARQSHDFTAANLSAYLDDELTPRQKKRVEQHLATCEPCCRDLALLERTAALLRRAPMRPVPRSFALPASAQSKQTSYQRWNSTYGALRSASVMVTLLLVLLFSGDALVGQRLAPSAPLGVQIEQAAMEQEKAIQEPMPAMAPAPTEGAREVVEAPKLEASSEPAPPMALMAPAEVTVMVEQEALPEPALARGVGGGEPASQSEAALPPVSVPQTSGARLGSAPTSVRRAVDAATPGGVVMLQAPSPEQGIANSAEDRPPLPTAAELSALPQQVTSTPWQAPTETGLAMKRALATPIPDPSEAMPPLRHIERSPWWSVWRVIRVASGVLLGMLLMLVATLVLVGQKRRV
jgi:hypothetical protein